MKKLVYFFVFFAMLSISITALAQDIYLKAMGPANSAFPGLIKGSSKDKGHEGEIEVFSYSQGIAGCVPKTGNAGSGACKATVGSLNFMMELVEGTNPFRQFVFTGVKLPTADFVFEKRAGERNIVTYKIHMEDVTVVTQQESGSVGGGGAPTVSVEFSATRIAWGIYEQDESGRSQLVNTVGFNVATNTLWTYAF